MYWRDVNVPSTMAASATFNLPQLWSSAQPGVWGLGLNGVLDFLYCADYCLKDKDMALLGVTENSEVYSNMRNVGCCRTCCLRYMGEKTSEAYRNVDEWITKKGLEEISLDDPKSNKQMKPNPCIVCLGLLQGVDLKDTVKKIASCVTAKAYDCESFSCAVSIPIAFQLRAYSLWFHLVDTFPLLFEHSEGPLDNSVVTIKDAWKWSLGPLIAQEIGKDLNSGAVCDFSVGIGVIYDDDEEECSCLLEMHEEVFKERKLHKRKYHGSLFTRKNVESLLNSTDMEHFKKYFPSPPSIPTVFISYDEITCMHNSIYFAGCYNKFSRSLSQTPWVIEGERKMESSVQEVICDSIEKACVADGSKFVASGREDVDVRMLGRGRPFACEVLNPHKIKFTSEEIRTLEKTINSCTEDVTIRDLQLIPKEDLHHLKEGEESKHKRYSALCMTYDQLFPETLNKLETIREIVLSQKTPIRVLHRRPLAVRNRTVYSMKATSLNDFKDFEGKSLFKLDIVVQAGTYIKEFVHGDFGRTKPNLGLLLGGVNVDILALDVEEIMLDWPPPTQINLK